MVALKAWFDPENDDPTIVHTAAELDAVLDEIAGWDGPNIVELLIDGDPGRAILDVGMDTKNNRGTLYYSGEPHRRGCFSRGTAVSDTEILYYYMDSDTEYPADAEIPLAIARQAAHEYMATGGRRPTCVAWQPWR
ncbi:MAG TPA: Imm1 family immunity protein [Pseudonocardiaceae bacterium]|nr:Imm1 family immunity protein [Pseudonocardiaceae bacterium]